MTQIRQSEDVAAYNRSSLEDLAWGIEVDQGEFALKFAHCNYVELREQLSEQLQAVCEVNISELRLDHSDTTLYTKIREQVEAEKPAALMILGLETVRNIDELLRATNQVREEFRKNFPFPIVVWIDDKILLKFKQLAPDFKDWGATVWFAMPLDVLVNYLRQTTDSVFTRTLQSGSETFLPNEMILGENYHLELKAALEDLQSLGQELSSDLQASCEFIRGRANYGSGDLNSALQHYHSSLDFWQQEEERTQQENDRLREANLYFHAGLCYCSQAEQENQTCWENAKQSFQQCLDIFEQFNRQDLVAKFINSQAEVLANLEDWEALRRLAKENIKLHTIYENRVQLAQDYGFLAAAALKQCRYQEANKNAELALEEIQKGPRFRQKYKSLYWLLLAQAQEELGEHTEAVKSQEEAAAIEGKDRPYLCLRFLEELQALYLKNQYYVDAYRAKQEQLSIKEKLGLIAFVGANRLTKSQPLRGVGRKKDVDNLVERIGSTKNKITIIYGQSGVGKSSLVEAELIQTLKQIKRIQTRDLLTVYLRVYTDWVQELGERLKQELAEWNKSLDQELEVGVETQATQVAESSSLEAVFQQLKRNDEQENLLTVLIFDQFEEFFFVAKTPEERQIFFQFFSDCLSLPFVKIILSLREDYLHLVLQGTRQVNLKTINDDILDKDILYYVGNFSYPQATEVIVSLTESSPFSLDSDLIERLVQKDLINEFGEIRPIELQVVGAQLQAEDIRTLEAYEKLGDQPKEVLIQEYLEAVIRDCGEENKAIAELVLSLLVDETNRTRPLKTRAELEKEFASLSIEVRNISQKLSLVLEIFGSLKTRAKLEKELASLRINVSIIPQRLSLVLEIFVLSGLVFLLPEIPENRYQLVHDYLVDVILQQRGSYTLAELRKEREQRLIAEAKLKRFFQRALIGLAGVTVIFAVLTFLSVRFALQVRESEIITLSQSSKLLYNSTKHLLEPLIEALKAGRKLKPAFLTEADTHTEAITALKQALFGVKELNRLVGHDSWVISVAFSSDGKTLASASSDKTVKLWNLEGKELLTLSGHDGRVWGVAFSPDGKTLASANEDKTVKLWNLEGKELLSLSGHDDRVNSVAFSPDGKTLASASSDKTVKLWNLEGKELLTLSGHDGWVWGVAFSPDGKTLASASEDKTVKLRNLEGKELLTLDIDSLLERGCNWVGDYLRHNPNVRKSDRTLCKGIGRQK
ncbi:MAG: AAA family ATPase [Xenococcaceae cyanobacterium]